MAPASARSAAASGLPQPLTKPGRCIRQGRGRCCSPGRSGSSLHPRWRAAAGRPPSGSSGDRRWCRCGHTAPARPCTPNAIRDSPPGTARPPREAPTGPRRGSDVPGGAWRPPLRQRHCLTTATSQNRPAEQPRGAAAAPEPLLRGRGGRRRPGPARAGEEAWDGRPRSARHRPTAAAPLSCHGLVGATTVWSELPHGSWTSCSEPGKRTGERKPPEFPRNRPGKAPLTAVLETEPTQHSPGGRAGTPGGPAKARGGASPALERRVAARPGHGWDQPLPPPPQKHPPPAAQPPVTWGPGATRRRCSPAAPEEGSSQPPAPSPPRPGHARWGTASSTVSCHTAKAAAGWAGSLCPAAPRGPHRRRGSCRGPAGLPPRPLCSATGSGTGDTRQPREHKTWATSDGPAERLWPAETARLQPSP